MSGPGGAASMWDQLTTGGNAGNSEVVKDWTALCAAWARFHATVERDIFYNTTSPAGSTHTAAVPPGGAPASAVQWPMMPPLPTPASGEPKISAVPVKPDESKLAAREQYVLASIQSISGTMTAEITQVSTVYMRGGLGANQVNDQMARQYNFGLGAFQLLRVEASALKDLGKPEALRVLDLFVDDTQKALGIVGGMVTQQRAFEMGISKIWQKTMTEITATQLEINNDTRRAYDAANKNYFRILDPKDGMMSEENPECVRAKSNLRESQDDHKGAMSAWDISTAALRAEHTNFYNAKEEVEAASREAGVAEREVGNAQFLLRSQDAQPDYLGKERDVLQKQELLAAAEHANAAASRKRDAAIDRSQSASYAVESARTAESSAQATLNGAESRVKHWESQVQSACR